jgi:hypothetical protein
MPSFFFFSFFFSFSYPTLTHTPSPTSFHPSKLKTKYTDETAGATQSTGATFSFPPSLKSNHSLSNPLSSPTSLDETASATQDTDEEAGATHFHRYFLTRKKRYMQVLIKFS